MLHRQDFTIVPDAMVCAVFNAPHSNEDRVLDSIFGGPDSSRQIETLNVMGGWGHRVVRQMIEDVNKGYLTGANQLDTRIQELEQKAQAIQDWCSEKYQQIPKDIYDEKYTTMPIQLQTTYDTVSYSTCI